MKTLTIMQPWATLVALGARSTVTLPWSTPYRGPLAIHAAEIYCQSAKETAAQEPFRTLLRDAGFRHWVDLPTGSIVAVCQLDDCRLIGALPDEPEADFGTYKPGYYTWHFSNVRQLPQPVHAQDAFGLWEWCVPAELATVFDDVFAEHAHGRAVEPAVLEVV